MRFNEPYGASRCPRLTVMSGPELFSRPRRFGRGAALTLVFASVLATGVATGSWSAEGSKSEERPAGSATGGGHEDVRDAAAEAMADGKSPTQAAEEAVSRSGDRWGAVYSQGEYKEFEQELDGQYTGVGLWARRTADGRIEVSKVGSGSPAAHAGVRPGDRLRTVDGRPVTGRPVTEVVSLLRGEHAGTAVRLGLTRGTRAWTETLRRANLATEPVTVSRLPGGTVLIKVAAFTKGSGDRVRSAVRDAPTATASSSTCGAIRAAWSRRRSPRRRRSSTAGSWRRTTYGDASAPCTPSAAVTPPDRWSRSSTAAR